MSTVMTKSERERFLAEVRIGVLSVASTADPAGTLAVPIWYDYSPERGVWVITSRASAKGKALEAAGRYSMVVQQEETPYKYVSVEGPIVEVHPADREADLLPMAIRYFGPEVGAHYTGQWAASDTGSDHVYTMRPQHWASTDLTSTFIELQTTMTAAAD